MEETISLKEIFNIVRKRGSLILISLFAGISVAGVLTYFVITPQYSSRAQMIVSLPQNENATSSINDINFNLQMLNTYRDIINQSDVLAVTVQERLASEYGFEMTTGELQEHVSVEQSQDSQMFSIVATNERALDAERIANTVAEVFQETVTDVLNNVETITIVSRATASNTPISPNNQLNLAIGLALGLMVGIGIAFLLELIDRTVKDQKFVAEVMDLTILGVVPEMSVKELNATTQKLPKQAAKITSVNQTTDTRRRRSRI